MPFNIIIKSRTDLGVLDELDGQNHIEIFLRLLEIREVAGKFDDFRGFLFILVSLEFLFSNSVYKMGYFLWDFYEN